jgi:hypothetical protein
MTNPLRKQCVYALKKGKKTVQPTFIEAGLPNNMWLPGLEPETLKKRASWFCN